MTNEARSRRDKILEIIVQSYVETAEPVGSRTISRHSDLGLSPASIRNVMADLEEEGFLMQPHTSAGRIPTDKGYRYFVDALMGHEELSAEEKEWVTKELGRSRSIEGMAENVSKVISKLTENAALMYIKNLRRLSFLTDLLEELAQARRLGEFLEEEPGLFMEGAFRVFDQPEFQDARRMRVLLEAVSEKDNFLRMFLKDLESEGIHVHIGSENALGKLDNVSLVVKDCYLGTTPVGGVAVMGPTRMRYTRVVAVVDFVADTVTESMRRF